MAVSCTMSPVTQTPEVAVNRASTREIRPDVVVKGRRSSIVPTRMAAMKLMAKN